jgi:hypothetical protein
LYLIFIFPVIFNRELEEEKICLQKKSEKLKEGLYRLLIPPMQVDSTKVVMEIRAGTYLSRLKDPIFFNFFLIYFFCISLIQGILST